MKWIKAEERRPGFDIEVIVRNTRTGKVRLARNLGHCNGWNVNMDDLQFIETEWLDESPSSDPAEVQQLRQWKKEATALLDPILEYGLKHPDIKLGQSATSFVLNRAKAAEVLVKALEEIAGYVAHNGDDWAKRTAEAALIKHKNQANEVNNDTKNEG